MREETYSDQAIEMRVMDDYDEPTYANVGDVKPRTRRDGEQTEPPGWFRSPYKVAAVCLGVLVILLLATTIGLGSQLANHDNDKRTEERDRLQTSYNNLTKERDQLQTSYIKMIEERELLQRSNNNLTAETRELQRKVLGAARCPTGSGKFTSTCYYISMEKNTRNESRQDCVGRRADLVIINSLEEQKTVIGFNKRAWIGLIDVEVEETWKWVDGTPLTSSPCLWRKPNQLDNGSGNPGFGEEDCVEISEGSGGTDGTCDKTDSWIC